MNKLKSFAIGFGFIAGIITIIDLLGFLTIKYFPSLAIDSEITYDFFNLGKQGMCAIIIVFCIFCIIGFICLCVWFTIQIFISVGDYLLGVNILSLEELRIIQEKLDNMTQEQKESLIKEH